MARGPTKAELLQVKEDFDWLIFYSASVHHDRDGERCWVRDYHGKVYDLLTFPTPGQAIAHARHMQSKREQEEM